MHSLRALNRNPHLRRSKPSFPSVAHVYNGHSDLVRAVDFRTVRSGGTQTFQLVSWSKDQTLRLWCIDEESLQVRSLNTRTHTHTVFLSRVPLVLWIQPSAAIACHGARLGPALELERDQHPQVIGGGAHHRQQLGQLGRPLAAHARSLHYAGAGVSAVRAIARRGTREGAVTFTAFDVSRACLC